MFKLERVMKPSHRKSESSKSLAVSILEDIVGHPLMIAYSGLVNDDVRKKAKEAGFKVVIEAPLTVHKI
jgi:hypothetical protein